jgi:hypothetical protein
MVKTRRGKKDEERTKDTPKEADEEKASLVPVVVETHELRALRGRLM